MSYGYDYEGLVRYSHVRPEERNALMKEAVAALDSAAQLGGHEAVVQLEASIRVRYGASFCRDALGASKVALVERIKFEVNKAIEPLRFGNAVHATPMANDAVYTALRAMKNQGVLEDFATTVDHSCAWTFQIPRIKVRVKTHVSLDTIEVWCNLG